MTPTPPGGTAATSDASRTGDVASEPDAVPPPRSTPEVLPRRVRGASDVGEIDDEPEPVDEATLQRLLSGLRQI